MLPSQWKQQFNDVSIYQSNVFSLQKQETYLKKVKKGVEEKIRASTFNTVKETNEVDKNSQDLLDIYHNYKPISTYQSQYLRV